MRFEGARGKGEFDGSRFAKPMVEKCGKLFWVCDICDMFFNASIRFAQFE